MNIMIFIRLVDAVVEARGLIDTTPSLGVSKRHYRDGVVCIEKRFNPPETIVTDPEGRKIMHLRGINLLHYHYDENRSVFDHLLSMAPGILLDVLADQHEPPA
jgi:hypothetical protein